MAGTPWRAASDATLGAMIEEERIRHEHEDSSAEAWDTGAATACTRSEAAAALNGPRSYSAYGAVAGLNKKATRSTRGAISLSSSSHLPAIVGDVAARLAKLRHEAAADRIGNGHE